MITRQNGVGIVASDMLLLDTRQKENDLASRSMAGLVLQALSYVAHIEREKTKCRQGEGIKLAKARGMKSGRPVNPGSETYHEAKQLYHEGRMTSRKAC